MSMLMRDKPANQYLSSSGEFLPGVTTVLSELNKPAVIGWANKMGRLGRSIDEGKEYARDVGNLAHYLVECHIKCEKPEFEDTFGTRAINRANVMLAEFISYAKERGATFVASETQLVDTSDQFGGTIDIIADCSSPTPARELWDIKTSSAIWAEQIVQVCAYQILSHQHNKEIVRPRIILIPKSGELRAPDIPDDVIFLAKKLWFYVLPMYYARRELNEICSDTF